jgi:hypothetical protein
MASFCTFTSVPDNNCIVEKFNNFCLHNSKILLMIWKILMHPLSPTSLLPPLLQRSTVLRLSAMKRHTVRELHIIYVLCRDQGNMLASTFWPVFRFTSDCRGEIFFVDFIFQFKNEMLTDTCIKMKIKYAL